MGVRILLWVCLMGVHTLSLAESSLSGTLIERWIASQEALATWGDQHEAALDAAGTDDDEFSNPFTVDPATLVAPLKKSGLYGEAKDLMSDFGFSSPESWAEATLDITRAAAALEFDKQPNMFDMSRLKQMLAQAELPPDHKRLLEKALAHNAAMIESLKAVSTDDKNQIRPFLDQIGSLLEE